MDNREKKLVSVSIISIIGNAVLSLLKIVVGLFSGSLAVVADGVDSAGDVVASLITLFTARIISRPPNPRYPYGYGKAETVATKALSFIIFFAGAQLAISTIKQLTTPTQNTIPDVLAIYVTLISIGGKLILSFINISAGKKTGSSLLIANGRNMQTDILISLSVLAGLFFTMYFHLPVFDTLAALMVGIWVMKVGFGIFMESNLELMDGNKSPEIYNQIFDTIDKVKGVQNPHRVRARKIGYKIMIAIDIEMDGDQTLEAAHNKAHEVEKLLKSEIDNVFDVAIHIEPIGDKTSEKKLGINRDAIDKFWC